MPAGRPDLVFVSQKIAIFIDGCFWHGCPEHYVRPRSRTEFWSAKLEENVCRDHKQTLALEERGWKVIRAWEHDLFTNLQETITRIERVLHSGVQEVRPEPRVIKVSPLDATGDLEARELTDLRDLSLREVVNRKRTTKKW